MKTDGRVNLSDAAYALTFLFLAGTTPPLPFPDCGEDPTEDAISDGQNSQASC